MSCGMLWNHNMKSVKSFTRRCQLLLVTESDGDGKPTPWKAFYVKAHYSNLQRYYLYQNVLDAKLYRSLGACSTCSWDSLTSFLKKTLEKTCTENVAMCPKLPTSFPKVEQEKEIRYFAVCWPYYRSVLVSGWKKELFRLIWREHIDGLQYAASLPPQKCETLAQVASWFPSSPMYAPGFGRLQHLEQWNLVKRAWECSMANVFATVYSAWSYPFLMFPHLFWKLDLRSKGS